MKVAGKYGLPDRPWCGAMPPMTPFDPATLAFYAVEAPNYAANGPGGVGRHLEPLLERLTPGAHILELGCGSGRDAAAMIARGFAVEPTDGVPEMAAQTEARLGQPVRVMRFDQLEAVAAYDGILAAFALLHVPRDGLPDVLQRIWRALKPGGWHGATYKTGGQAGRDRLGRYYNYPTEAELREFYAGAGHWDVIETETGEGRGYEGGVSAFVSILLRKAG
jgi:SAM-dependent methyltransferase